MEFFRWLRTGLLPLAAIAFASAVSADDDVTKHFACDFDKGYSWTYEAGSFKSAPPSDLSFEIGSIDLDKQSASAHPRRASKQHA